MTPRVFVKNAPADLLAAEARGLDWLRVDGGPPLPAVLEVSADRLTVVWIEPGRPSAGAAAVFGERLARLHASTEEPTYGADSTPNPNRERPSTSPKSSAVVAAAWARIAGWMRMIGAVTAVVTRSVDVAWAIAPSTDQTNGLWP